VSSGKPTTVKPTVIIVDDSDEVRLLVRSRLQLSGLFDVVADGRDGAEAIGLAYQHQPSLMLLDTSMPTMDGLEALPGILTLAPQTKVVIFTGFEERSLAGLAKELGATEFIEKSYPIDQLPARLAEVIGSVQAPTRRPRLRAIGDRHKAAPPDADQQVLSEHLERFREVFEEAAIGMATLTLNGSIVRANRALAKLLHCEPEDLVGIDYGQVTSGKGDDFDRAMKAIQDRGDDLATFEHEIAGYSETRFAQATVAPVRDSAGVALYGFLQVQDITAQRAAEDELRLSEERFRLLISAVEEYAIFMLDTEGHVASWNAGAQRIKGYTADEIIGKHFRIFYPAEHRAIRHPEHELELALQNGQYGEEGWRIRKDGSRFWASVVITAVFDDNGRHVGFAKVTRDQTERRMSEEHRERAAEQQTQLLANTAHELRSPTAVIDGSVSTVMTYWDQLPSAERDQLLANVRTSTRRLQQLTADLLTASRLEAESLSLRPAPATLETLLTGAVERAKVSSPGLRIDLDGDLDIKLTVDIERIGQALDNLIINAMRHGRPPIQVSGGRGDGDTVVIRVADAGLGVSPDIQPRLFDRFAAGGHNGGAGLGLYIVREVIRMHGGEVRYRGPDGSEPSQFVITLPGQP
jgi:PAS domain S-box-containing protein